jgi:hypothetical protein
MARYAARENIQPGNLPVAVDLVRHWRLMRAPDQTPNDWNSTQFVTNQSITPEDLK